MATINTVRIRVPGLQGRDGDATQADINTSIAAHVALSDPHTQYLERANNLSDVTTAATAFANIKQAATTSATGVVELATEAETEARTDTGRAVTPSGLVDFALTADVGEIAGDQAEAAASSVVNLDEVYGRIASLEDAIASLALGIRPETVAFYQRTDGALSTGELLAYDTLIRRLIDNRIWESLDTLKVFAAPTEAVALLDIKDPAYDATLVSMDSPTATPTFTPYHGFTTDGVDNYIDTNYAPSSGSNFSQNDACYGIWALAIAKTGNAGYNGTAGFGISINPFTADGTTQLIKARINSVTAGESEWRQSNGDRWGFFVAQRVAASGAFAQQLYKNGQALRYDGAGGGGDIASAAIDSGTIKLGVSNTLFGAETYRACLAGSSLTSAQHSALYFALLEFYERIGAVHLDFTLTENGTIPRNYLKVRPALRGALDVGFASIANGPAGYYDETSDTIYFTWEHRHPGIQDGSSGARSIVVRSYNRTTGEWSPINHAAPGWDGSWAIVSGTLEDDTHGLPAIAVDGDGYIYVFGGCHATPMLWAKSVAPYTLTADSAFTVQTPFALLANMEGHTYPHTFVIDGVVWLGMRGTSDNSAVWGNSPWWLMWDSVTETQRTLVWFGLNTRFYQALGHVYDGKIYQFAARSDNADTFRADIYCFVFDPADGSVSNLDGSVTVASGSLPINITTANASFRLLENTDSPLPATAFIAPDDVHIVYGVTDGSGGWEMYYRHWDGTELSDPEFIFNAPYAFFSCNLLVNDDGTIDMFYGHDPATEEEGANLPFDTAAGDMVKRTRLPNGHWTAAKTVIKQYKARRALAGPNVIANGPPEARIMFTETTAHLGLTFSGRTDGFLDMYVSDGNRGFLSPHTDAVPALESFGDSPS